MTFPTILVLAFDDATEKDRTDGHYFVVVGCYFLVHRPPWLPRSVCDVSIVVVVFVVVVVVVVAPLGLRNCWRARFC